MKHAKIGISLIALAFAGCNVVPVEDVQVKGAGQDQPELLDESPTEPRCSCDTLGAVAIETDEPNEPPACDADAGPCEPPPEECDPDAGPCEPPPPPECDADAGPCEPPPAPDAGTPDDEPTCVCPA